MPRGLLNAAAELDVLIAELAESEWARLTSGLSRAQKASRVSRALDSLHGSIRRLEMPAYYEGLVALFYLTWYQPFQINSARSLLDRAIAERQESFAIKSRLDIVDFGGGALAMEIGLALALLDAQQSDYSVPDINVMVVEPSEAMSSLGLKLWERFLISGGWDSIADPESRRVTTYVGSSTLSIKVIDDLAGIEVCADADRWLVAMHAYYAEAEERINGDLSGIHRIFQPEFGVMTFHHASCDGIKSVSPFVEPGFPVEISPLRLSGALPLVSSWRRCLAYELGLQDEQRLTGSVEWDPMRGPRDNRAIFYYGG